MKRTSISHQSHTHLSIFYPQNIVRNCCREVHHINVVLHCHLELIQWFHPLHWANYRKHVVNVTVQYSVNIMDILVFTGREASVEAPGISGSGICRAAAGIRPKLKHTHTHIVPQTNCTPRKVFQPVSIELHSKTTHWLHGTIGKR